MKKKDGEGGFGWRRWWRKRRWEALKAFAGEDWTKKQNEVEGPHCCVTVKKPPCTLELSDITLQQFLTPRFGGDVSVWLAAITLSQFHFLFYSSRPLPNIMVATISRMRHLELASTL